MIHTLIMQTTNTIKTATGNAVTISTDVEPRIKSVVWSDGMAMIEAKSNSKRDELVTYYRAWGLTVETVDSRGLTVY